MCCPFQNSRGQKSNIHHKLLALSNPGVKRLGLVYTTTFVGVTYVTQGCEEKTPTPLHDISYTSRSAGVHCAMLARELLLLPQLPPLVGVVL